MTDSLIVDLRRLQWKCRRGMLELDNLLMPFIELGYNELTAQEKRTFDQLLGCSDQVLLTWLLGSKPPEKPEFANVIEKIRSTAHA